MASDWDMFLWDDYNETSLLNMVVLWGDGVGYWASPESATSYLGSGSDHSKDAHTGDGRGAGKYDDNN